MLHKSLPQPPHAYFSRSSRRAAVIFPLAGCWLGVLLLAGCSGSGSTSGSGASSAPGGAPPAAAPAASGGSGEQVYAANGCSNCHVLNGQGGRQGPDLTHAGASHDAKWLADHVKDPKAHKPGSRMPSFQGRISDADLTALGEYLASLK